MKQGDALSLRKGWEIKKLGEVCEIVNGSTPLRTNKEFWDGGEFPWFTIDDIREQGRIIGDTKQKVTHAALRKLKVLPVDTILLCCTASIGEYAISKIKLTTNQQFNGLVIKNAKEMYPMFLLYFSSTLKDTLSNLSGKATIDFIPISRLKEIEIPLPPLPEQQRIVAILDEAFAAIAKAKANAEQNLKNAKELFESYLQGVFESKGEGWEEKTLGEIADVEYGYTDKSTEEGDYRYIRITDIDKNGELILDDKKYIKHSKEAEGFLIQENDLLMARTGATFAKVLLFNGEEPSVFASYLIRIKFKAVFENALYWHFTKPKNYWDQAKSLQSGAAQPHFNGAAVKQVVFAFPKSIKVQRAIIEKFEKLSIETKKLEAIYQQKINDLEELKKSVLQKAFSGELKTATLSVA